MKLIETELNFINATRIEENSTRKHYNMIKNTFTQKSAIKEITKIS